MLASVSMTFSAWAKIQDFRVFEHIPVTSCYLKKCMSLEHDIPNESILQTSRFSKYSSNTNPPVEKEASIALSKVSL